MTDHDIAWRIFLQVRKQILQFQKIRAQLFGFKIAFVSAAIGIAAANLDKIPLIVFVVPAFAAIFFDLLIASFSYSIKRSGFYCRNDLEPAIRESSRPSIVFPLW